MQIEETFCDLKRPLLRWSSDVVGEDVHELVYSRERHTVALVDEERMLAILDLD